MARENRRRRRTFAGLTACGLALSGLAATAGPAAAGTAAVPPVVPVVNPSPPRVVLTGLNNPRQLQWDESGRRLIVAEAGKGGSMFLGIGPEGPMFAGLSGSVSVINKPWRSHPRLHPKRVVTGLFSTSGPDGSFATGSDGADSTDFHGEYIIQETYVAPEALAPGVTPESIPGADQLGFMLVSEGAKITQGGRLTFPFADIAGAERTRNPGGGAVDSDPYAVVFVDPTPHGRTGADGYALIADAASNTVWKMTPDFSTRAARKRQGDVTYTLSVFASYPDRPATAVEFVPTSLALDGHGAVYVAGLGSLETGQAQVVKYDLATGHELGRWTGFSAITGIVATSDGFIVSQLLGNTAALPPTSVVGNVVKVTASERRSIDVPFPAGLATDAFGNVYVSAYSVFDDDGPAMAFPGMTPRDLVGQVWSIRF